LWLGGNADHVAASFVNQILQPAVEVSARADGAAAKKWLVLFNIYSITCLEGMDRCVVVLLSVMFYFFMLV
jgi:hypothetical protein